jgi:Family of unknown function (DUF6263)
MSAWPGITARRREPIEHDCPGHTKKGFLILQGTHNNFHTGRTGRNHMNVWRWLGISLFLMTAVALIGTNQFTGRVGGQEKGKTTTTTGDKKVTTTTTTSTQEEKKTKGGTTTIEPKQETKGGETLVFKAFEKGSKFYQKQYTKTEQKMTANNQPVTQTQEQTFIIEWSAGEPKDGKYVVTQKIVGVKMEINIGGNKISYDSTTPQPKNPMTDFFDQLMNKSELEYIISKNLTVEDVKKSDELIKALGDVNPQMQSLLKEILSSKALKKMAEPTWWAYPEDGKIPADKKWKRESKLDLGPIGTYDSVFNFDYKDLKDGKDTIGITTSLKYTAPTEKKAGLPFEITKADLKSDSGAGTAVFDRAKGRFASSTITMKLNGTLTIAVSGMNTDVTLDQTQTATSETFDTLPKEWERKK